MSENGKQGRRQPAMIDVAKVAGVSAQTVSRVLSDHPSVQAGTRARVLAAVDELGYRRNIAARMLSSGRSRTIGVVTLTATAYSTGALVLGIEEEAHSAGYQVSTVHTQSLDATALAAAMRRFEESLVEGIILAVPTPATDEQLEQLTRRIPTITIDGSRTASTDLVAVDQRYVAKLATQHLIDLGHASVWHVAGQEGWLESTARLDAWRSTLAAAGHQAPPELRGDWSAASGYQAGLVLSRIPEVTAVFAASDEMAFGVIRALHETGREVPTDVSVVGVDDIPLATYSNPPLTTVAQPFEEIGRQAVTKLVRQLENPVNGAEPETVLPKLIVRESTAAPTT